MKTKLLSVNVNKSLEIRTVVMILNIWTDMSKQKDQMEDQGLQVFSHLYTSFGNISVWQNHTIHRNFWVSEFLYFYGITCLHPRMTGIIHSGSVACVLSSIRTERNCILASLGSPAPTHVQQITSVCWKDNQNIRCHVLKNIPWNNMLVILSNSRCFVSLSFYSLVNTIKII